MAVGLEPVILADQVNAGKTIIEKFERNVDVGYAVVLLSPDDYSPQGSYGRARQNVILEWGYFIGRLVRSHVCALKRGHVDLPSDIIGMVWENFDEYGGWKRRSVKELIEAGVAVDEQSAHGMIVPHRCRAPRSRSCETGCVAGGDNPRAQNLSSHQRGRPRT